jgi:HlyD family secretion protein
MMKKKIIWGAVILAVIAGVILTTSLIKKGKSKAPVYRTEALAKGDIEALVVTSGTVNPVDIVEIGSQVSGKIIALHADFNSVVKAGEIVAEIDQEILKAKVEQNGSSYLSRQASLESAKVILENAKKKWDRTQDLFSRQLVSFEDKETAEANYVGAKVDLQVAEATLAQQKSALDQSKVDLSYAIIRSPIDGTVITRNVNMGQTVAAGFTTPVLFKVASDLTNMQVECAVDEADIGRVKEGQKVRFSVDAFQGETFTGEILQVRNSPTTTNNVVTYSTIIKTSNPDLKLRPGMTATVSIITGEARGILRIPSAALKFTPALSQEEMKKLFEEMRAKREAMRGSGQAPAPEGAGQTPESRSPRPTGPVTDEMRKEFAAARARNGFGQVWILEDSGQIHPVPVRTGISDNSYAALLSGDLKEGMKVILGTGAAAANQQQGAPMGMMFGGPPRR